MRAPPPIRKLDAHASPLDLAARWPLDLPLVMLHSGGDGGAEWARWSILAAPAAWLIHDRLPRVERLRKLSPDPLPREEPPRVRGRDDAPGDHRPDPIGALEALLAATRCAPSPLRAADGAPLPFKGGWIGCLSYDLGRVIEPAAQARGARTDRRWPLVAMAWCPDALLHDGRSGAWYAIGEDPPAALLDPDLAPAPTCPPGPPWRHEPRAGPWHSSLAPDAYLGAVARAQEYIAAGDVFQVNLAQRLTMTFEGSTRALARRALSESGATHGALLELPGGRAIVSMSPELFFALDGPGGGVVTRPIKGTRPSRVDPRELLDSSKDAAELAMIVDLMRNDLGRVRDPGTVTVPRARTIETHRTVHHGVGEVRGRLRAGAGAGGVLRAAFPAGSITGAPKIRAMQIIDELEPVRRGAAYGAIGAVSDDGAATFSVAIRTMLLSGRRPRDRWDVLSGRLDYAVGGGIVADSVPIDEYRESLDKAAVLKLALPAAPIPAGSLG